MAPPLRWCPVRAQRSVGVGVARPVMQPRNRQYRGADVLWFSGRQHRWRRFREPSADLAGSKNRACARSLHAENRDIPRSPACRDGRAGRAGRLSRNPVMDDREKSDGPVVPRSCRTTPKAGRRRRWREADRPRGTRPAKRVPDTVPGTARPVGLVVCAEWQQRTRKRGSPRSCTTLTLIACGRRTSRFGRGLRRGWTA